MATQISHSAKTVGHATTLLRRWYSPGVASSKLRGLLIANRVPGIVPRCRRSLLTAFGSLAAVRRATREELDSVVGSKAAAAVIDYFAKSA